MRFLDANVFIYSFYKPKGKLSEKQLMMKKSAKKIIESINDGKEDVITTVVHLSEVANILKRSLKPNDLQEILMSIYFLENVTIQDVSSSDYLAAIDLISELRLDPNDCLAVRVMRENEVDEIYTFDRGFEGVKGITRLPEL